MIFVVKLQEPSPLGAKWRGISCVNRPGDWAPTHMQRYENQCLTYKAEIGQVLIYNYKQL